MTPAPQRTRDDGPPPRDRSGLVLALACGLAATVWRYEFLDARTLELLGLVMRAADPEFLPNDVFIWSGSVFGPRTPLLTVLGLLARVIPFDWLYLGLTALTNLGLALLGFAGARALFDGRWAPRIAAALVCAAPIPALAESSSLAASAFVPDRLALALVLLGVQLGALARASRLRGLKVGSCVAAATLVDPGVGLASAVLVLALLAAQGREPALTARELALAAAPMLTAAALVLAPMLIHDRALADESFVAIVALHRHPGLHTPGYVLRAWPNLVGLGSVVVTTLVAGRELVRRQPERARALTRTWLALALALALLVGASHVFVELWPWRAWLLLTPLRCFDLLSWIALILAAGAIGQRCSVPGRLSSALLGLGLSSPLLTGPVFVGVAALERWTRPGHARRFGALLLLLPLVSVLVWQPPPTGWLLLVSAGLLGASANPIALALASALLAGLLAGNRPSLVDRLALAPPLAAWLDANFRPRWRAGHYTDDASMLARDVRRLTPPTSVIITPPEFGRFRLLAERAIVVDFDGLPDHDRGVAEWAIRMLDCYGPPKAAGAAALPGYQAHYDRLTDQELVEIAARHHANFAVISTASGSRLRPLLENDGYALVVVPRPVTAGRVRRSSL